MDSQLVFYYQDEDSKISYESLGVTTDEVMKHFVCFLLAIGYERVSVCSAMQELVEEYKQL